MWTVSNLHRLRITFTRKCSLKSIDKEEGITTSASLSDFSHIYLSISHIFLAINQKPTDGYHIMRPQMCCLGRDSAITPHTKWSSDRFKNDYNTLFCTVLPRLNSKPVINVEAKNSRHLFTWINIYKISKTELKLCNSYIKKEIVS